MANEVIEKAKDNMKKSIAVFQKELGGIRAGVANASLLDGIKVNYYGVPTPLTQMSSVSIPEARVLMVTPYDKSTLDDIEHAILASDLGITPANDGTVIRIVIPQLTGERRQEIAKQVGTTVKEVSAHAFGWKKALTFRKNFVANHPKKIEVANRIIEARKDKKIITFNSSIEQCKKYGNGVIVSSKQSKKENQRILKEFAEQKTGVIHSSKMLIEGLDCPGLSVEIIAGFNSSKCEARQKIGRTIRFEEGKQAEIFTLVIKGTVEDQWYKKANEDNNFIEINEEELDLVLKGELDKKAKTQQKINNEILRY